MKKVLLELTEEQVKTLSAACELVSRLYLGQVGELRWIAQRNIEPLSREEEHSIKKILFPELTINSFHSIHSTAIPDDARQLWDIYQVIRHYLAWKDQPNTPETRKWPEQMYVQFDEPWRTSVNCPLPKIKEGDVAE